MAALVRTLTADRGDAGRRLDLTVRRHLSDLHAATRTRVQAWISRGLVTVNGASVTRVSARTVAGDVVSIAVPQQHRPQPMEAERSPLAIVYEDDTLLAVDKPAGRVVHPTYRHARGTIMNALLWHARDWPVGQRPSLVGRLDKDTSGLLLVARTGAVHRALQAAGEAGAVDKEYLAIVHGCVAHAHAIDRPLARDPRDRRRVVVAADGARSLTMVEPLAVTGSGPAGLSLLRCRLVTGRSHQIRVHLASGGWPIVGDPVYGSDDRIDDDTKPHVVAIRRFPRQALHAWRLTFRHPVSGAVTALEAPVPPDMQHLLTLSGLLSSPPLGAGGR